MKTMMTAAMAAAVFAIAVPASAQPQRYDHKLERAAAAAFAARAGTIRGTFGPAEKPVLLTARKLDPADSVPGYRYRPSLGTSGYQSAAPFHSFVTYGH